MSTTRRSEHGVGISIRERDSCVRRYIAGEQSGMKNSALLYIRTAYVHPVSLASACDVASPTTRLLPFFFGTRIPCKVCRMRRPNVCAPSRWSIPRCPTCDGLLRYRECVLSIFNLSHGILNHELSPEVVPSQKLVDTFHTLYRSIVLPKRGYANAIWKGAATRARTSTQMELHNQKVNFNETVPIPLNPSTFGGSSRS